MTNKILLEVSVTDKYGADVDIVDALEVTQLTLSDLLFHFSDNGGIGTSYACDKNGEAVFADGRDHDDKTAYIFYIDETGA